ncbi:putative germin-like protein 2-1 [Phtheirospermum japonicum]|uniref:Germin-like protein n=1 Tax=Phtheirospermum japonicum TaxID=374723 RepID=A0A830CQ60_9LAMI|nr:putative germin-like protein 2-1 [Phtheirospermum japonicum]
MAGVTFFLLLLITSSICIAFAFDLRPLHDFCVADDQSPLRLSGALPCKDPKSVTADDFYYSGLDKPNNITNAFHAGFKLVGIEQVPGLNTLGLSMARLDLGPNGFFPLHFHKVSELHLVIKGKLEVGFISPEQGYKYYNKTLKPGDMYVVPPGLIHVQRNPGIEPMSSYTIFNGQKPGIDVITQAVFAANPMMDTHYLAKGYKLDDNVIKTLQSKPWP